MNRAKSVHRHATRAFDAYLSGDRAGADEALDQLNTRHGPAGITGALLVWCDTALSAIPRGEGPVRLEWVDSTTGNVHGNPDQVPPAEQWAGRLLAARAAGDRDMFIALVNSAPPDEQSVRDHVGAMLQMAARIVAGAS